MARDLQRRRGAKVILVAGFDAEQEVPILHLRLRKAAAAGAQCCGHPRRTRLRRRRPSTSCVAPGGVGAARGRIGDGAGRDPDVGRVAAAMRSSGEAAVVIAGPRLADGPPGAAARRRSPRRDAGPRFAYVHPPRERPRGAAGRGVHPGCCRAAAGSPTTPSAREVEAVWGR